MNSFKLRVMARVLPFLLIAPGLTMAQTPPPSRGEAMAAMKATPQKPIAQYTRQQIDQLIAPIALYPDELLAQVLMAATYPQQLIEAADWLQDPQHGALQGDELMQALEPLPWDPSVKALVAFPQIIAMMTEHLEWSEALGVAFATQQAQVMQRVQRLRQLAVKSGRIRNVKHVTVHNEANVIRIVSAEPDRVFVPVYNPTVVYGPWPDRDYPPIYIAPPRHFVSDRRGMVVETIEPGFGGYSYPVVAPLWGWTRPDWRSNQITIRSEEYRRITRDVRPPPNDRWQRNGPMVIVAPPAGRSANRDAGPAPAGTVAPAQAAAVTALPQQAARQPDKVRIEKSAAPAFSGAPGSNTAANPQPTQPQGTQAGRPSGDQPGKAQTERAQADKAQADKAQADKAQADKAQADKAQADRARAEKAQADKAHADKAQADKAQAEKARAGKAQADKAQADKAQAEKARAEKAQADKAQADKAQAEQARAARAQADKAQADRAQAEQARAARAQADKARADRAQAEQARAARAQADKAQAEQARAARAQADRAQADRAQAEQARAARAQADKARNEQARGHGQEAARPAERPAAMPSQAGPAVAPSPSAERPAPAGQLRGQGSSTPPSTATAPRGDKPPAGHQSAHPADKKQPDNKDP